MKNGYPHRFALATDACLTWTRSGHTPKLDACVHVSTRTHAFMCVRINPPHMCTHENPRSQQSNTVTHFRQVTSDGVIHALHASEAALTYIDSCPFFNHPASELRCAASPGDGTLAVMMSGHVYRICALSWRSKMEAVQREHDTAAALRFACSVCRGSLKAYEDADSREVCETLWNVLERHVVAELQTAKQTRAKRDGHDAGVRALCAVCIECVIATADTSLASALLQMFSSYGFGDEFLEFVQKAFMAGEISQLPPDVVQALLQTCRTRRDLHAAEQIIMKLHVGCFDFHEAVKLCREEQLYAALVHLYVSALDDVVTPAQWLLSCCNSGSPHARIHAGAMLMKLLSQSLSTRGRHRADALCWLFFSVARGVTFKGHEDSRDESPHEAVCGVCRQGLRNLQVPSLVDFCTYDLYA
jgi:hypothetical protein